jgi:hypothetical protein
MHYWGTADFIRRAVPYVNALDFRLTATPLKSAMTLRTP